MDRQSWLVNATTKQSMQPLTHHIHGIHHPCFYMFWTKTQLPIDPQNGPPWHPWARPPAAAALGALPTSYRPRFPSALHSRSTWRSPLRRAHYPVFRRGSTRRARGCFAEALRGGRALVFSSLCLFTALSFFSVFRFLFPFSLIDS